MIERVVGIQGEPGCFHEEAANQYYGEQEGDVRYVPFESHELLLHNLFIFILISFLILFLSFLILF